MFLKLILKLQRLEIPHCYRYLSKIPLHIMWITNQTLRSEECHRVCFVFFNTLRLLVLLTPFIKYCLKLPQWPVIGWPGVCGRLDTSCSCSGVLERWYYKEIWYCETHHFLNIFTHRMLSSKPNKQQTKKSSMLESASRQKKKGGGMTMTVFYMANTSTNWWDLP